MIIILLTLLISISAAQDIYGCTDPEACNYNPEATIDDWSCEDYDCAGVCGGNASYDDYDICCDSPVHMWPDWDGDGLGWPYISTWSCNELSGWVDNNDDPHENCFSNIVDECGVCDGSGVEDNCGVCDEDPENDCQLDCTDTWGGGAVIDDCGVCCGGETGVDCSFWNGPDDFSGAFDCEGNCGGTAQIDDCGVCCAGETGVDCNADIDCSGECFGTALIDECGICCDGNTGLECNQDLDCAGICFGENVLDDIGDCCLPSSLECGFCFPEPWVIDCNGECFGTAIQDECGMCCDGSTGVECSFWQDQWTYGGAYDCSQECFGESYLDDCGQCCAPGEECPSARDCNDVCFGTAIFNDCGCVGGDTGFDPEYCMGCMDPESLNFDPDATVWDDSCIYMGDVNDDNNIDVGDLIYLVAILLGELEMTDYALWVGDVNGDDMLSIIDIVWLVDIILNG